MAGRIAQVSVIGADGEVCHEESVGKKTKVTGGSLSGNWEMGDSEADSTFANSRQMHMIM